MRKKLTVPLLLLCLFFLAVIPVQARQGPTLVIRTAEGFLKFAENCRLDSYSQDLIVSLDADIDLSGTDFSGIPYFCGTFQGNGHTISGVSLNNKGSAAGLFRYLSQTAQVLDLTVQIQLSPQGSRDLVGGVAGENAGVIRNCHVFGSITGDNSVGGIAGMNTVTGVIDSCSAGGDVYGTHFVGGIAGDNYGVIRNCENQASVNTTVRQNQLDITDITIGTITGTESTTTVTNIGGITGENSGTIRSCINRGTIGYRQVGYNIGGIAGSHVGYLVDCKNYGAVFGRKDVGGIVGQAEPSAVLRYEADTLQLLRAEMAVLSELTDRVSKNTQSNISAIRNLLLALENHSANAQAAIDSLIINPEAPQLPDPDSYLAAFQTLSSSLTGMDNTLRQLRKAISDAGADLESDMQAISQQMEVIDQLLNNSSENLGGSIQDVSDADTPEDLTAKIENCTNFGAVSGDLNIGGIAGTMGIENDLDPEEDLLVTGNVSLNAAGDLRCVILQCNNRAPVTANKRYAGGIAGLQSMGLVRQSIQSGNLLSENADYVGGIAGRSMGYLRNCSSKCSIFGKRYVGGIAGSGSIVSGCCSIVELTGSEWSGAILGRTEESFLQEEAAIQDNFYLRISGDIGGIDGISYQGKAQPLSEGDFLALPQLPESFRKVTVSFLFADGTQHVVELSYGGWLKGSDIPALPKKEGFTEKWEGLSDIQLRNLYFDATVTAVYTAYDTVIQSDALRPDGRPVLLIQGSFPELTTLHAEVGTEVPPLSKGQILLECWRLSLSQESILTKLRFLPEKSGNDHLSIFLLTTDGTWQEYPYTLAESYLVLEPGTEILGLALVENTSPIWPWIALAVGIPVVALGIFLLCKRKAVRKKSS